MEFDAVKLELMTENATDMNIDQIDDK